MIADIISIVSCNALLPEEAADFSLRTRRPITGGEPPRAAGEFETLVWPAAENGPFGSSYMILQKNHQ
jgi:hypothetical protein